MIARDYENEGGRTGDAAFYSDPDNEDKFVRVNSPLAYYVLAVADDITPTWLTIMGGDGDHAVAFLH